MCGIAGIVGEGAEHQLAALARMSERIAHRGPDDSGVWTSAHVALAHRRLSIIDLSHDGHQPMTSDCERYSIVFNGEIYNYRELRSELEAAGEIFRGGSDTEVLLVALRRWGADALSRCNGMWAFALWDARKRTLFAARDRFGKKPFYYALHQGRFHFASEIKALLAVPGFVTKPEPSAVADFAAERISDHVETTFFSGVLQLLPAHVLTYRDGSVSTSSYWSLPIVENGDYRAADADEIRDTLKSAVELRLRADTSLGCLLSGGLDSSTVTCLTQELTSNPNARHAFSTVYDKAYAEADGIPAVREIHPEIVFHPDRPTAEQFWRDLPEVLWHQEQPFGDASMIAHYNLMRLARRNNVPVLLSGQGADEVFAGYPGYLWTYLGSRLRLGDLGAFLCFFRDAARYQSVPLKSVALNALPPFLVPTAKRFSGIMSLDWLAPEFRKTTANIFHSSDRYPNADPLDQALLQSIEVRTLPGFLHYEDRNSMAHGVETRLPFLDYRLAELLFRQPPAAKVAGGMSKRLLRDAAKGSTPDAIRLNTLKTGYPAPLEEWLKARPLELTASVEAKECPLLDWPVWDKLTRRFLAGERELLTTAWRGFIIARWHAMFFGAGASN
jgi:asparagine synthase (glutamine-hydrolysing)